MLRGYCTLILASPTTTVSLSILLSSDRRFLLRILLLESMLPLINVSGWRRIINISSNDMKTKQHTAFCFVFNDIFECYNPIISVVSYAEECNATDLEHNYYSARLIQCLLHVLISRLTRCIMLQMIICVLNMKWSASALQVAYFVIQRIF